jgi:hypothetical protein
MKNGDSTKNIIAGFFAAIDFMHIEFLVKSEHLVKI